MSNLTGYILAFSTLRGGCFFRSFSVTFSFGYVASGSWNSVVDTATRLGAGQPMNRGVFLFKE